jgi:cytochrome c peroxidase
MISFKKMPGQFKSLVGLFLALFNLWAIIIIAGLSSCKKDKDGGPYLDPIADNPNIENPNKEYILSIPKGFPYPDIPDDNKLTVNRIELGKLLFFDPILSRDSTISCASCHAENYFFADSLRVSSGVEGRKGTRNSPSLVNVAYQPSMFWDGGNPTLEQQILGPFDSHVEFDFDIYKAIERLLKHPQYPELFKKAYNQDPSVFSLTRAIAAFERTIIGGTSRYDDYIQKVDTNALNASEKNGLALFFSEKAECFHCHQGFLLTDFSFRNNGLYENYADSGRARITQIPSDVGKFKVPSLRNVAKTAPYMHDGSLSTLEEVLDHYISGGKKHNNKSPIIQPLSLTVQEKNDLINFLKSLTDK